MKKHATQNQELLDALLMLHAGASKNTLRKKLSQKMIYVNDEVVVNPKFEVSVGDCIEERKPMPTIGKNIPILYQDSSIIVVVKPPGLLSVNTTKDTNSLHSRIKRHVKAPVVYPVHRLDKETSGLIVFALTQKARDALKSQMAERKITREYHALIHGAMEPATQTVTLTLNEKKDLTMEVIDKGSVKATTTFTALKQYKKTTLVHCKLHSGKKHQIRVTLAHLGWPILGDETYGAPKGGKRMCLHAFHLEFSHPVSGKKLTFTDEINFGV